MQLFGKCGKTLSNASDPYIIARHFVEQFAAVGQHGTTAGQHNTRTQFICQLALLNDVEHRIENFAHSGCNDFREVLDADLFGPRRVALLDAQKLVAHREQFIRAADAEGFFDVFSKGFGQAAFVADVHCHAPSPERNGIVVTQYPTGENGNAGHVAADIDQRDAVLDIGGVQHHFPNTFRHKELAGRQQILQPQGVVDVIHLAGIAQKYLVIALDAIGEAADNVIFSDRKVNAVSKGLTDTSVNAQPHFLVLLFQNLVACL